MSSRDIGDENETFRSEERTTQLSDDYDDTLQDSEMTQPTDGSVSEDEAGGWLGSIGTDFRNMATCFKDSTLPVIGSMASLVHKTAMTVAAEIAQLERDGDPEASAWEAEFSAGVDSLSLPWEIQQDSENKSIPVYVLTDEELMDAILSLSSQESTFSSPFATYSVERVPGELQPFVLDEPRIALIRRLLDVDENLAAVHARLSGQSNTHEVAFWRNYFHHCETTRKEHLERRLLRKEQDPSPAPVILTTLSVLEDGTHTNNPDDASLIPVSVTDDSSYVIYPAPSSIDTFMSTRSLDDMVLVGRETDCEYDDK